MPLGYRTILLRQSKSNTFHYLDSVLTAYRIPLTAFFNSQSVSWCMEFRISCNLSKSCKTLKVIITLVVIVVLAYYYIQVDASNHYAPEPSVVFPTV